LFFVPSFLVVTHLFVTFIQIVEEDVDDHDDESHTNADRAPMKASSVWTVLTSSELRRPMIIGLTLQLAQQFSGSFQLFLL
jgi:hypothetical protein